MPLLAIVGPTATGKTELSVRIARNLGSEIVSADSMLIYRYMNIGTAKPTISERKGIPHHMIDVADPDEMYNVAIYSQSARKLLREIYERGNLPILAGGTGLYIKAVIDGYNFSEAASDHELREKLKKECESLGREALHDRLKKVDPETASRLHINDVKRVIRALEVYYLSGKTISSSSEKEKQTPYNLLMYGLTMDREKLYARIEERVDKMIGAGLVEEVKDLLARGFSENLTSMQGLGYKEIILYLKGKMTLDEAVDLLKKNTRRFAKRQLTWFRRDSRIIWADVGEREMEEVASEITRSAEGVLKPASNVF
ncbi:MAG: tRNA (adenosine(37)-N6)-dimethylallyltransferase MiaA [Bacillota bacterium]